MLVDNLYHYILYGIIILATVIILKLPKNEEQEENDLSKK
jgi:hypothetical protein